MANTSSSPSRRGVLDAISGPIHPAALSTLGAAWADGWADPRRLYREARQARTLLDQARAVLAEGLGVRPEELSLFPDGPEALRTGLAGLRYAGRRRGAGLVASAIEQSAILSPARYAAGATPGAVPAVAPDTPPNQAGNARAATPGQTGPWLAEVPVDRFGRIDIAAWQRAVGRPGVAVAALQAANAEVGTRQPLEQAHEASRRHGIPLLVDATASLGRDPTPRAYDVLAGDARSWGGPPGIGVLVVPARTRWRRPGPPSELEGGRAEVAPTIPLALAAAEAWRQLAADAEAERREAHALVERIRVAAAAVPEIEVVGDPVDRLPHVVTFSALLADGEALVLELDRRGFAVASGSACTASTMEPSHVLAAMGVLTHGNVRVTLPLAAVAPDRAATVWRFCAELPEAVATVRAQLVGR